MKIEIRNTTKDGLVQITSLDERFYAEKQEDESYIYYPSSSWIASYYPKSIALLKWLADRGWDEAEHVKQLAGERGSKIHNAIELLIKGEEVKMEQVFPNHDKGTMEELTPDEWEAIMSFVEWHKETKPEYIANEYTVINKKDGYAGTVDIKCKIDGKLYLIDVKTSQSIWPSHEIQLSSYKHADEDNDSLNIAILQVGYRLNKRKYKFTELEDKYNLFLATREIWKDENENKQPKQILLPQSLKL